MSLDALLLIIVVLNGLVAVYVLYRNPQKVSNRAFAGFVATAMLWALGSILAHSSADWADPVFPRLAFVGASLAPVALLFLIKLLPQGAKLRWQWDLAVFAVAGGLFALLSSTPLIVIGRDLLLSPDAVYSEFSYGPLYHYYAVYISLSFIYVFGCLVWQYRHSSGPIKLQLRYLILALVVPVTLAAITNLLIPLFWGTSRFSKYGPLFSLLMIAMIGHAIIRHRLMDIRVVIKKGVVYVAAFIVAGALLTGLIVASNALIPSDRWSLSRELLLGLFVAFLFHPLKSRIQRGFDRYLYRGSYNYQQTLREASRRMAMMLDLDSLLPYLCELIGRTTRPEMVRVYIRDPAGHDYVPAATRWFAGAPEVTHQASIPEDSALPHLLRAKRAPVLRDDLAYGDPSPPTRGALTDLTRLGGELAVPIWVEDRLNGLLVVGSKLSGDPFFSEDLDLLSTLTSQAGVALKNAQLHHEVVLVKEYLENILKTMENGVVAVNIERMVTLFNPTAERITGLMAADIRFGSLDRLPAALSAPIEATLADGQPCVQVEVTLSELTGRAVPVVCTTSPFRDVRGHVLGTVLVFSDLTPLKELQGEKQRAERLTAFEAGTPRITHEIKNLLVAIKTFVQLVPKKFADEEFRENFSKIAVREIARVGELVDRLTGIATTSARPLARMDLRDSIEETLAVFQGQLEQTRITVSRLYDADLPSVAGDPAQLKQLFLNLFKNATEAMEPGGELSIRLSSPETAGRHSLVVEVSDTGSGIPEAVLGRVFDPFVTTKPQGSGLGLSICRGIADAHRATIQIRNRPHGCGTTVVTEFPVAEPHT